MLLFDILYIKWQPGDKGEIRSVLLKLFLPIVVLEDL